MGEKKATKAVMQETLLIHEQIMIDLFQQFKRLNLGLKKQTNLFGRKELGRFF